MEYNKCTTCKADNGRAGMLLGSSTHGRRECLNCHYTRKSGSISIHSELSRTDEEMKRTFDILNQEPKEREDG